MTASYLTTYCMLTKSSMVFYSSGLFRTVCKVAAGLGSIFPGGVDMHITATSVDAMSVRFGFFA